MRYLMFLSCFLFALGGCQSTTTSITGTQKSDTIESDASDLGSSSIDSVNGPDTAIGDVSTGIEDTTTAADADLVTETDTSAPACDGEKCPIKVAKFPYIDNSTTKDGGLRVFKNYNCAPKTDEGGAEKLYAVTLPSGGTLVAAVISADGADVDIHLLSELSADKCLTRHDKAISRHLPAGTYYIAVDTFVTSSGKEKPGSYELRIYHFADDAMCGMVGEQLPRIRATEPLLMPATGKIVKEAHLVTQEEDDADFFSGSGGWPTSFTDGIQRHYELTKKASGYEGKLSEPWAPCCEPSNKYGQGSTAKPPAKAEAWYVNMRWKKAPTRGTRYLVFNPFTGKAVVAAAGYENGPGDLTRVGGASEEIHRYLDAGHLFTLTFGELQSQTFEYGPISCFKESP